MNVNELLAELPTLTVANRQLLIQRAAELDDKDLSAADEALVALRLAEHYRDPPSSITLEEMKNRLRARMSE